MNPQIIVLGLPSLSAYLEFVGLEVAGTHPDGRPWTEGEYQSMYRDIHAAMKGLPPTLFSGDNPTGVEPLAVLSARGFQIVQLGGATPLFDSVTHMNLPTSVGTILSTVDVETSQDVGKSMLTADGAIVDGGTPLDGASGAETTPNAGAPTSTTGGFVDTSAEQPTAEVQSTPAAGGFVDTSAEQPTPETQPAPVAEQPTPEVQSTSAAGGFVDTSAEQPTPVVEQPTPEVQPAPVAEQPTPEVQSTSAAGGFVDTSAEQPTPVAEQPTPEVQPAPVVEQPTAEVQSTSAAGGFVDTSAEQPTPEVQPTPVAEQPTAEVQPAPVVEQPTAEVQPTPVAEQPTPVEPLVPEVQPAASPSTQSGALVLPDSPMTHRHIRPEQVRHIPGVRPGQVVMIGGRAGQQGKTALTFALAHVASQHGLPVIILDGDTRDRGASQLSHAVYANGVVSPELAGRPSIEDMGTIAEAFDPNDPNSIRELAVRTVAVNEAGGTLRPIIRAPEGATLDRGFISAALYREVALALAELGAFVLLDLHPLDRTTEGATDQAILNGIRSFESLVVDHAIREILKQDNGKHRLVLVSGVDNTAANRLLNWWEASMRDDVGGIDKSSAYIVLNGHRGESTSDPNVLLDVFSAFPRHAGVLPHSRRIEAAGAAGRFPAEYDEVWINMCRSILQDLTGDPRFAPRETEVAKKPGFLSRFRKG